MERIMELRKVALLTLIVAVLLSGAALAGGWQYSGVGARAKAMGGAFRGIADDGSGAYVDGDDRPVQSAPPISVARVKIHHAG